MINDQHIHITCKLTVLSQEIILSMKLWKIKTSLADVGLAPVEIRLHKQIDVGNN